MSRKSCLPVRFVVLFVILFYRTVDMIHQNGVSCQPHYGVLRMKVFCERLKELRGSNSQKSFAALLKLNQQTYQRYESGVREPDLETLHLIGVSLGVSLDWLLGLSDARTMPKASAETPRSVRSRPGVLDPNQALREEIDALKRRVNALESSTSMACG